MLTNGQLFEKLDSASRRYSELKVKFGEFSSILEENLQNPEFFVKGISVKSVLDLNYIDINFVGRLFRLVFSSGVPDATSSLLGIVRCNLVQGSPEKLTDTGGFTFKPSGESNINPPPQSDPVYINFDLAAIYIALHLINEGLAK